MAVKIKYRLALMLVAGLWMGAAAAQEPVEDRFFAQLPNEVKVAAETEATSEDQARQEADARVAKLKARQEAKAEAARLKAEQKAKAEAEKQAAAEARAAKLKAKQEAKAEVARLKAEQKAQTQAEKPVAAEAKRAAEPEAQAAVAHAEAEKKAKAEELPTAAAKRTAEAEAARVNAEKKALADTQAAAGGSADKPKAQSSKEEDFAKDVAGLKAEQKAQVDTKAADEAKAAKLKAAKSDMLIDFVQKAVLQNPDVLTRWHNFQAAVNETSAARGVFLPRVDMTVDAGRERGQSAISNYAVNTKNVTFTLTQMLYDGFATLNDVRRLNNAQLARYYELLDASETAALEAARAFYDMSRQRKLFELTEDNYVRHRTAFEQIKLKVEAGVGRRVDLEQAAGRLALSESNLVLDNANVHDVSARFQRMIGVLPPAKMRTSPSQAKLAKQILPNAASAVLSIAVDYHPAILAAVENVRSARYDLYGRWAKYQPTVNLSVAQTHSKNLGGVQDLTGNATAKVTLNWNLYSGGSDSARSSQYVGRLDSARDLRDKACRDIRMTLAIAYNDISKLTEQLKFLDQHQLSIEKALAAYQKQFDIGQRSLLDLLDTENELYQAKRSYTNAEYDLAIAYTRTIAGMGRLVSSLGIAHLETKDLPELLGTSSDAAENCPMDAPLANNIRLEELDARAIEQAKAANEAARAKEEAGKEQKAKEDNAFLMTPGEAKAAKAKEEQGVKAGGELKTGQDAKAGEAELAKLKAEQEAQAAAEEKAKQAAEAKAAKIKAKQEAKAEAARLKAEQKAKAQAEKQAAAEAKRAAEAEAARLKAEQKAKAEAEKRGAAEEKAKQEAEARVAKLKAKEEAKAEAARVKAEQDAKAQTEKQAQQEAKAEVARLKTEQKAKAEAEKQVAAEEKAKQEAEARVAKLKAKEEAKVEAARVKAEQEAKAQAEKQAAVEAKRAAKAEAARLKVEQEAQAQAEREAPVESAPLKATGIETTAEDQTGQEPVFHRLAKQKAKAEAARAKAEQKAQLQAEKQMPAAAGPAPLKTVEAEDQARQEAEARVAKLKAKMEAKEAAARLKAEQKAKTEAEKQAAVEAKQAGKAEASRIKTEQEAQVTAEAEEKARQEADIRVAKLKAKVEAKAEAARLKAEQKAQLQIQAGKQAAEDEQPTKAEAVSSL